MEIGVTDGFKTVNVSSLCTAAGMSRPNWYKGRKVRERRQVDERLVLELVKRERKQHPRSGGRKLHTIIRPDLADAGISLGRDRIFAILRRHGLLVPPLPRSSKTTDSQHSMPVFHNRLKEMEVKAPNQAWVSDITYIRTESSFVYLALMMDRYSRKIVGYHCGESLEALGAIKALEKALADLPDNCHPVHHSDRGCQYCCRDYVQCLLDRGLTISMTETEHCAENAHAERLNGILKQEYGLGMTFLNLEHARLAVDQAVWKYNHRRPHLSLGMRVPADVHRQAA